MICENGQMREETAQEILEAIQLQEQTQQEYWSTVAYKVAVDTMIKSRYTVADELAILR